MGREKGMEEGEEAREGEDGRQRKKWKIIFRCSKQKMVKR
jgi:hypothetical protein